MNDGSRDRWDLRDDDRPTEVPESASDRNSGDLDDMGTVVPDRGDEREQQSISFKPGAILSDRFEILSKLGTGGMGAVFKVADKSMPGTVKALKVMLPSLVHSDSLRARFRDEVQVAQNLTHRNIVRVHDLGHHDDLQYFTMEFVEGKTLHEHLRQKGGSLPLDEILPVVYQVCDGLVEAHKSTVHRDLKPQNIMVQPDGTVKLLDFGLAKLMAPGRRGKTAGPMGTAYYEAPEQRTPGVEVGPRADIYALGVILYEMLTGQLPTGMAKPPSEWNSSVPAALDNLVHRMLQTDPADRPSSAAQVRDTLKTVNGGAGREPSAALGTNRRGTLIAITAVAGVFALAVVLMLFSHRTQVVPQATPDNDAGESSGVAVTPTPSPPPVVLPDPEILKQQADERAKADLEEARMRTDQIESERQDLERRNAQKRADDLQKVENARNAMNDAKRAAQDNNASQHAAEWFEKGLENERKGDSLAAADKNIDAATAFATAESHYRRANQESAVAMAAINAKKQAAERERDVALNERDAAQGSAAAEFAKPEWSAAEDALAEAEKVFENDDYEAAAVRYGEVAKAYKKTSSVAARFVPTMVFVQGGTFSMGSAQDEIGRERDEGPVNSAALSDFYLAAHEVTVAQFRRFVEKTGHTTTAEVRDGSLVYEGDNRPQRRADANWQNPYLDQTDDHPVTCVSWHDAEAYCKWLSGLTGKQYRLPTEAEWEYACRAGSTTPFSAGQILTSVSANFNGTYPYGTPDTGQFRKTTVPVTEFAPNNWGFYNMHGNIAEWCADWYSETAYTAPTTQGPDTGRTKIVRGGAWNSMGKELRSADRAAVLPDSPTNTIGFRIARTK